MTMSTTENSQMNMDAAKETQNTDTHHYSFSITQVVSEYSQTRYLYSLIFAVGMLIWLFFVVLIVIGYVGRFVGRFVNG